MVDSGIDTTHSEFRGNSKRIVRNLFAIPPAGSGEEEGVVSENNDVVGHGTHCAGIIGGRNTGVAPSANVFGIKVMDDNGMVLFILPRYFVLSLALLYIVMRLGL